MNYLFMSNAQRSGLWLLFPALFLGLAYAASPDTAGAQQYQYPGYYPGPTAQLVITAQTASGVTIPTSAATVTVTAAGPSLTGIPSSIGTLSYTTNFTNETKVVTMVPGNYSVSVAPLSNYTYTYSSGCVGTLSAGQTGTCTITLGEYGAGQATLTVYTNVGSPYYGGYGPYAPANFQITVSGNAPSPSTFQGSASGTTVKLGPGSYSVHAQPLIGWTSSQSGNCSGIVQAGDVRSCTITYSYTYPGGGTYPYTPQPLTCAPAFQTVSLGAAATFYAQGGAGTYSWTTPNRTYTNIGPVLNAALQAIGTQTIVVSSGTQTATCTVSVVAGGVGTIPPSYTAPGGTVIPGTFIPSLPNTGFAPHSAAAWAFAFALLVAVSALLFPYVRTAFAHLLR